MTTDKANLLLIAVDSLRADHMSLHGYHHLTTPHVDRFAAGGAVFENCFSPHIPTTPAFGGILTGRDCFGTDTVALRHVGPMAEGVPTLAEVLREEGYLTSSVGFEHNVAGRGFESLHSYQAWASEGETECPKAEAMNAVAVPELEKAAHSEQPFFLFLRAMDPHAPYLPPDPFKRIFYGGDECDAANKSMDPVRAFEPFRGFFTNWIPPNVTDKDYIVAQYDGAIAYLDICLQRLFGALDDLGLAESTLVVLTADHGESLYEHECYFDHHGLYEPTLRVPLVFRMPGTVPAGGRFGGNAVLADVMPTILDILGVDREIDFEGQSLFPEMAGERRVPTAEFYITECTWMRKHGWRTPQWKLIHALEPDFHFKPEVELYNLVRDPEESENLADVEPKICAALEERMQDWIARREKETGRTNPMHTNPRWHGARDVKGPFESSQQAYDVLRIGALGRAPQHRDPREKMLAALGYL